MNFLYWIRLGTPDDYDKFLYEVDRLLWDYGFTGVGNRHIVDDPILALRNEMGAEWP